MTSADTPKIQYPKEVEVRVRSFGETRHMNPQKPNENGEREEVQRDISYELLGWLQEFRENLVDECTSTELLENPEQGSQHTSKSSH